jgi:hypothetical protein
MRKLPPVPKELARRYLFPNNITFPRALRDAIPHHELALGRCLKVESADAQAAHTDRWGRRVQVKLRVCETGKLTGAFDIWVDLEIDAAKALAETIQSAVERAEVLPAVKAW